MSVSPGPMGLDRANVAHMLWCTAERAPDAPAIVHGETRMSYAALRERAAAFALALGARGLRRDDRVVVFLDRGVDAAAAFFGIAAAGGIAVIVNETLRPRQLEHALAHSGARYLITSAALRERQPRQVETTAAVLPVEEVPTIGETGPVPRYPGDVAQIIYTSGSTGLPKGVTVTHANLWAAIETVSRYLDIGPEDRTATVLPFNSVYGLNQLLCSILRGGTLVIAASPIPHQTVEILRREKATVLAAVPPLWTQFLATPSFVEEPIPSLRVLQNAGGHLPPSAVRLLREAQPQARLFLQYGMTEVFRSTFLPPEEVDRRPDSMGLPMPGVEIRVVHEDGTECAPGEVGELVHRGPTVALGYWNDPETTARTFRPNAYRPDGAPDAERVVYSGDLVRRDEEGFLYFVGRRDRMIKTLGYRVGPDEVASVLYASGEVGEALVAGEPDRQRGERIVAYVVLSPNGSLDRLKAFCRMELPRYMQPARFDVREALPRTVSGKHDLNALLAEAAG